MGKNKKSASAIPTDKAARSLAKVTARKKATAAPEAAGGDDVSSLQKRRDEARARKDWATADALRDRITALGYKVQDRKIAEGASSTLKLTASERLAAKQAKKERQLAAATEGGGSSDDSESLDVSGDDDDDGDESQEEGDLSEEDSQEEETKPAPKPKKSESKKKTLAGGVLIEDLVVGTGPEVQPRAKTYVQYVGRLASNGKEFDRSGGKPFGFRLGRGEVIKGWDLGVVGMRKGGKRRITCPPKAAYGSQGQPGIPPNSTLVFDVTAV